MTTQLQHQALRLPGARVVNVLEGAGARSRFAVADAVLLADVWVLLAILWASRVATTNLDPSVALFGLATFVSVVSPSEHRERLSVGALDDAGRVFGRVWLSYAIASAVSVTVGVGDLAVLLAVAAVSAPLLIGGRAASLAVERTMRSREAMSRALVVGGGDIAQRVIASLAEHDEYGLRVVGAADDDPKLNAAELGAQIVGGVDDVPHVVRALDVDVVIVAFSAASQRDMVDVMRAAMAAGAVVWVVPRFFELGAADDNGDHLWGLPIVRLQTPARSRREWILKRALDFGLAGIGVIALAPVLGIIALLIRLQSGRPILLRQTRVGIDGRPFEIFKFRTMSAAGSNVESTEWAADEARMTRVGRILRETNLDELPQLFNVLRGEMSLVGPRPERPYFVDLFTDLYPSYDKRHRLPAGVTGWAQVHGLRGDTSIEERAAFDNYYIENWSLAQDLKILVRTAASMISRK
jgi:exopolysaccharide biosynthesis polyprenyl glycosylphosphotransferase